MRRNPRVVAMGDSLTVGVGDGDGEDGTSGWAAHVAIALGASQFTNLAANGTRARAIGLTQVPSALMARPDIVLITVGGNDVLRGDFDPSEVHRHVAEAIARLTRPGRAIIVLTIDEIALFGLLGKRTASLMARRASQVNAALHAAVLGTAAEILDGAQVARRVGKAMWHVDRIHPSPRGHRALAAAAVAMLADRFEQVAPIPPAGPAPALGKKALWLLRQGVPWIAKRSRDLIPHVAAMVAHELLEESRHRHRDAPSLVPGPRT